MAKSYYAGRPVLVTGGLGFIGSNLVASLLLEGAKIRVLDHSWPRADSGFDADRIEYIRADIRDPVTARDAVDGCAVVFNLAGRSGSVASNASPLEDLDINCRGHLNLLEACRETNPGVKVVFPSSRLVYAPTDHLPVSESAPKGPLSIYGIHKLAAENYHLLYDRMHHIRATILRITNPYGPHQRRAQDRYGIINWFIQQALNNLDLTVYGDGHQLRDYVHIDDVIRALMMAGESSAAEGKILNVGSGHAISFTHMAELVLERAQAGRVRFVEWPSEAANVETGDFAADISLISQVLGWKPEVDFQDGIDGAIRAYRND
jgi:nucleoside-diphosphate-sugar epimerase